MEKKKGFVKKYWKFTIGTLVGGALLVFFIRQVSFNDVVSSFRQITVEIFFLCLGLTLVAYLFRALRLQLLFGKAIPLTKLFYITCVHTFANNVLPARTGELTLIVLAKRASNLSYPYLTSSLLVVRFMDFFWAGLLFVVLLFGLSNPSLELVLLQAVGIFGVMLMFLGGLVVWNLQDYITKRLGSKTHNVKWKKIAAKIITGGLEVIALIRRSPMMLVKLSALSVGIHMTLLYSTYLMSNMLGLDLSYYETSIGTFFNVIVSLFPIYSFLGIGVMEGSWVAALELLGKPRDLAITSSFVMHVIRIVIFSGLGFFAMFKIRALFKKKNPDI